MLQPIILPHNRNHQQQSSVKLTIAHHAVLEGGYDLEALAASVVAHCAVLSAGYPALLETDPALSTADVDQSDEEQSYGGDECAALAAYIASLDI